MSEAICDLCEDKPAYHTVRLKHEVISVCGGCEARGLRTPDELELRTVEPEKAQVFLRNADVRALGLKPIGVSMTGVEGEIPAHMTRYIRNADGRLVAQ